MDQTFVRKLNLLAVLNRKFICLCKQWTSWPEPNMCIDSLPNDNFFYCTKFKVFADDKLIVSEIMISVFDRVENIVGKGENAGYQHFLLLPVCFQNASFLGSLKLGIVW